MKKFGIHVALVALLAGVAGFSTPSRAETGQASTTKLVGRALNLSSPASIEGTYSAIGAGGAVAAGAGGVQLQNANGVILQLSGPKVGAEVSAAVGGVTVRLK
jgi:hypothetical protein